MVACALDPDVSGEVLGWKLPTWQAILLHRVLPSCGGLILFLVVMCYDITLIYEHYNNGHSGMGAFSIILMALPALLSLVFTLASPPQGLQTDMSAMNVSIRKKDAKWIAMQFVNCLFFPIAGIGRYCHQIFWWVEVVYALRAEDKERIREALSRARAPSPLELYLFLQAFIHSSPTALINILDLMKRFNNPVYDKMTIQAVSIIAGTLRMASTATVYRRFEREKLCGRKYPWSTNKTTPDDPKEKQIESKNDDNVEPIYEPILKKPSISSERALNRAMSTIEEKDPTQFNNRINTNSDLIQFSPTSEITPSWGDSDSDSGNSSDYLPPEIFSRNSQRLSDSEDEYVRPISIIDKVAPRRRDTKYTIERVEIVPPPAMPAPRPMSLAVWAEKMVENAESLPGWLSAPPRRRHGNEYIIPEEPELPRRVPRSYMRGLEPQDVTAALTQFLGWYAFFISRLLSIAAFIDASFIAAIIVLMSHYQIMLLLLIVPQASTVKRGFYVFLAFIYLFCLMEFKIRFKHVRVWHVFWIIVCTIETIVFTGVWSSTTSAMTDWWKLYTVKVILCGSLLSYMCMLVYFVLLKPRETVVYVNKNKDSNNIG